MQDFGHQRIQPLPRCLFGLRAQGGKCGVVQEPALGQHPRGLLQVQLRRSQRHQHHCRVAVIGVGHQRQRRKGGLHQAAVQPAVLGNAHGDAGLAQRLGIARGTGIGAAQNRDVAGAERAHCAAGAVDDAGAPAQQVEQARRHMLLGP